MHVTPTARENLYGVRTVYGTHPKQPRRHPAMYVLAKSAKAVTVAALATWYFVRPRS